MSNSKLEVWDFVAIGFYFAAVIGAGIYAMFQSRRNTVNGYFLAGRFMTWLPVGASLFASNIGSEHFIGLAGSGAASGIAVGAFELNACILLQLLGWVFLPVYIASGVCTLPEYIKKRFGGERIRIYLSLLSLMLYIFTKISVNLYSGALFIQQALSWNLYVSVLMLLGLTAITTITGGLAAVIYTDTLQAFVMIFGAFLLTLLGFEKVGGYSELYRRYMLAVPNIFGPSTTPSPNNFTNNSTLLSSALLLSSIAGNISSAVYPSGISTATGDLMTPSGLNRSLLTECGRPREDSWYMLRDATDPDMPWPGFLLGQTTASIWYWCADQMIVQRTLAAKSLSHAQGSTLFAGYLKILPVFILVLPGMISRVLFPDEVACVDPEVCMNVCQNSRGCSNIAFPKLVLEIMPAGLKGLMMSVMLAALVSDLTSIFNSASTLFTMDIYRNIRGGARNRELMIVGRVFVGLMVIVGILWIPIVQNMQGAQLFIYIQSVSAYLAPPIAAVYLMAILWKRANEKGAFVSLMVGLVVGSGRMILNFVYSEPSCGQPDDRPWIVSGVHYMYFAFFLFALTCVILVVVSLLSERPDENQIAQTTYWTRFDEIIKQPIPNIKTNESKQNGVGVAKDRRGLINGITNGKAGNGMGTGDVASMDLNLVDIALEGPKSLTIVSPLKSDEFDINSPIDTDTSDFKPSRLSRFVSWFCGMTASDDACEVRSRMEEIQKLKQTTSEKLLLSIFLVLLLIVDLFFYVFFSTGSDFGLLRSPSLQATSQ